MSMWAYSVIDFEPVTGQYGKITGRRVKWNRDPRSAKNPDATVPSGCLVECKGREVVEAADLVLELHVISEISTRRDRAVGTIDAILPRAPPLLNPLPANI
jgi:hypothetical protein